MWDETLMRIADSLEKLVELKTIESSKSQNNDNLIKMIKFDIDTCNDVIRASNNPCIPYISSKAINDIFSKYLEE